MAVAITGAEVGAGDLPVIGSLYRALIF